MTNKPEIKTGSRKSKTGLNEIWLEVGIDCDLKCSYCFNEAGGIRKEPDTLNIKNYFSILKQFRDMGGSTVGIPGAGEPLMKTNLETTLNILDFCGENNLHLVLFTNAQQMDDSLISRLNQDHVSLMIKYNSSNPEIQDELVGVKGYTKSAWSEPIRIGIEILDKAKVKYRHVDGKIDGVDIIFMGRKFEP